MKPKKRELLFSLTKKHFEVKTFKSGGKGGQHQNSCNSGVRITHKETGISSECREERSQLQNKKKAFRKLANKKEFRNWLALKALGLEDIEEQIEEAMNPENLKIEVHPKNKPHLRRPYDEEGF